jgi:hypothetical protein
MTIPRTIALVGIGGLVISVAIIAGHVGGGFHLDAVDRRITGITGIISIALCCLGVALHRSSTKHF